MDEYWPTLPTNFLQRGTPQGTIPGLDSPSKTHRVDAPSGMAKGCARALPPFCSLSWHIVLLCLGEPLVNPSLVNHLMEIPLAKSKGLSSPALHTQHLLEVLCRWCTSTQTLACLEAVYPLECCRKCSTHWTASMSCSFHGLSDADAFDVQPACTHLSFHRDWDMS